MTAETYQNMSKEEKSKEVFSLSRIVKDVESLVTDEIHDETKIVNLSHYTTPIITREYGELTEEQKQEIMDRGDGNVYGGDTYIGVTIFGVSYGFPSTGESFEESVKKFSEEIKASDFYKFFVDTVSNKAENKHLQTDRAYHNFCDNYKTLEDVEDTVGKKGNLQDEVKEVEPKKGKKKTRRLKP